MRKIREVLRLHFQQQVSGRQIASVCKISRSTVSEYIRRFEVAGLEWPIDSLSDEELESRLYPPAPQVAAADREPDWEYVFKELKRPGVTKLLIWQEYKQNCPGGYQYSRFCELYRHWLGKRDPVMRMTHAAGDKMFVDWAGMTMDIVDSKTGEVKPAQIFVAVLGASNYTFVKAYQTQKLQDWIRGHIEALEYFCGVPKACVPDNPRTAVSKPDYYDPELNPTYRDFAAHYEIAVLPARVRRPKDKAKVETAVQIAERWILAKLRNRTFFSVEELNEAIVLLLEELNNRPLHKYDGSRASLFQEIDRPALRALPQERYRFAHWYKAKAGIDYHVELDKHYYSVPWHYRQQPVEVRYTDALVEIFAKSKLVAMHIRSYRKGGYTTVDAHRPKNHRQYGDWPPERILAWADKKGPNIALLIRAHMEACSHPELGYRRALGIFRLTDKFGKERVDKACERAIVIGSTTVGSIRSILDSKLDQQPLPQPQQETLPIEHENLRGPDYYN